MFYAIRFFFYAYDTTMKISPSMRQAILAASLFIILSSGPSYKLTNMLLPTESYGTPTRLGLVVHAVACFALFLVLSKHI